MLKILKIFRKHNALNWPLKKKEIPWGNFQGSIKKEMRYRWESGAVVNFFYIPKTVKSFIQS